MKRQNFDEAREPVAQIEAPRNPLACHAWGCPLPGSTSHESGRWLCWCHVGQPSVRWPAITGELKAHDWLVNFIGDGERLLRDGKFAVLRDLAVRFWAGTDAHAAPTPTEQRLLSPYLYRMRGELAWRVGASAARPVPREPAKPTGRVPAMVLQMPEEAMP